MTTLGIDGFREGALPILRAATSRMPRPPQSFRNTTEAIQPVISAISAVTTP
jgi:hypothetical protein